jgi:inosine-uridine nucleoside N-ribohydrolase
MTHAISRRTLFGGAGAGMLWLGLDAAAAQTPVARQRVIVDTDPGNDDALALLMTLDAPNLSVEAITVCPGNVGPGEAGYAKQLRNALFMVDLAGRSGQVPVHAGMSRPILGLSYPSATFIHGKYGLGRVEVPDVRQKVDPEHAVDAIRRIVKRYPGEVLVLALGGLTNVAMALLREPELVHAMKGILFVGGRYAVPGFAPSYNVLVDPEAAHVVLTSGVPLTMVGGDVSQHDSVLQDASFDHIARFNTPRSRFFMESNDLRRTFEKQHRGTTGSTNPDPITVATLIDPLIGQTYRPVYMKVSLDQGMTRGQLVFGDTIYTDAPVPPPNVNICIKADGERFRELVFRTLQKT